MMLLSYFKHNLFVSVACLALVAMVALAEHRLQSASFCSSDKLSPATILSVAVRSATSRELLVENDENRYLLEVAVTDVEAQELYPGRSIGIVNGVKLSEGYYRSRGLCGKAALSFEKLQFMPDNGVNLLKLIESQKNSIREKFLAHHDPEIAALLIGLCLGDDGYFSDGQAEQFRIVGISHVVAVSGSNFATISVCISALVRKIKATWRVAISLAGLASFLLLVGVFNLPALRAFLLISLAQLEILLGQKLPLTLKLVLALICILLISPYAYRDVSLQLSFIAWAGVKIVPKDLLTKISPTGLPTSLREELLGPGIISFFLLPVNLAFFRQANFLGVIFNAVLMVPLNFLSLLAVWLAILPEVILSLIGKTISVFCNELLRIIAVMSTFNLSVQSAQIGSLILVMLIVAFLARQIINLGKVFYRYEGYQEFLC